MNPMVTTSAASVPETSAIQPSEGITEQNMVGTSRVPPMVYVDDEGLEEQFLTGDEASQVMDITANRVTTPVEVDAAPLNTIYTQRSQQDKDLDLQLSRGPRDKSIREAIDNFLDDNKKMFYIPRTFKQISVFLTAIGISPEDQHCL